MPAPQGGNEVENGHGEVGNTGDILEAEVVGQQREEQRQHGNRHQRKDTERRPLSAADQPLTASPHPGQSRRDSVEGRHKGELQGRAANVVHDRSSCFTNGLLTS